MKLASSDRKIIIILGFAYEGDTAPFAFTKSKNWRHQKNMKHVFQKNIQYAIFCVHICIYNICICVFMYIWPRVLGKIG